MQWFKRISHLNGRQHKFSNGHCELILLQFFFLFDISQYHGPTYTPYKQPNILSHFGEMDLNARVNINCFRVNVNFQRSL